MKILITGASSGLGAEFARQYASRENELILLARREEKLQQLQKELLPKVKNITIIIVDVRDFEALQNAIRKIENLDMVILNAGISLGHSHAGIPPLREVKNLFDINFLANHAILEVLLPKFQEQKSGKVVFISSLASLFSMPSSKIYSASKRALNAYAEGVKYKYAPDGVEVLVMLPGFIKSELTDKNDFKMPFLLETREGVARMKKAIDNGKKFYAFPLRFYLIIRFLNLLPNFLSQMIVNSLK